MGNPKQKWTSEEEEALRAGVAKHGAGKWKNIQRDPEFNHLLYARSNIDLKDKWRNLSVANGQGSRDKAKVPKVKTNPADMPATPLPIALVSTPIASSSQPTTSVDVVMSDSAKNPPEGNNAANHIMLSDRNNATAASAILTIHPPTSTSTPMNSSAAGAAKKSLQSFIDEERRSCTAPAARSSFESDDHHRLSSARTSCVSASSAPLVHTTPCSVESPWIRSPLTHIAPNYHCLASLYRSEGSINSMTIAKNYVITSSSSRRIHAWKLPDCSDMGCINASTGEIHAVLASGNLLISTHGDFRIRLWDVALAAPADRLKTKKMATLPQRRPFFRKKADYAHKGRISCVALNNADMLVYTGSLDHTVKVWSVAKKRCIDSFPAHDAQINAIAVNQHDGCVFTCSSDGKVKIWRRLCKESAHILTMTLKFQPSPINALALTNDTHSPCVLYSGSSDGLINFWTKEGESGRYNHGGFLQGHHFAVLCLVAVRDLVLSGSEDATIRVWRRDEGSSLHSCVVVIDGHHAPVKCLAAVMEGNEMVKGLLLVYSASMDQTLKVWRVRICNEERCSVIKVRKSETGENEECRMSPVLSPSWVQKKIQGTDYM